mmetsp:Transcript_12992/g.20416  ORF Transcript_12992/g.20416 Transcript_12992/m.20416 type:complete len:441 (-) Transcript_12992:143-1465(-)|eukprot:CAMPEP_0184305212 /NCGR_PEP_ID=MMETSP1049-20130417/14533_1 /TAXON_ID=77928 /ORGANISM="Proteomonas sulcata, Strain CCMP704" /LENGTH=440 /DNA_ID=CAMNT_0026617221 /DNA_START=168 /DNA_END=1490 /DNA_ORIENTATION=+
MIKYTKAFVLFALLSQGVMGASELKTKWQAVTKKYGEWGEGIKHERRGQICDPWREFGDTSNGHDPWPGCAVVFLADRGDDWTVTELPRNQQDNFQNTQWYKSSYTLHGDGFKGDSLPRAPQDLDPVCYIANVSGTVVLGYEEGNGDKLLPCPGHRHAYPFTEEQILTANDAELVEMCTMCYQSVCTGNRRTDPRQCGESGTGGVDVGTGNGVVADMVEQVNSAYHCHIAIGDEGTCDYVQYDQHEDSREYYMDYSVLCDWRNLKHMNLTHCDCTLEDGTANNCQRAQCRDMAYEGIVCGNCGGCDQNRAYQQIFTPKDQPRVNDPWAGSCAAVRTATTEEGRNYAKMMCSQGLFCRGSVSGSACAFHCDNFGPNSDAAWKDPKCNLNDENNRRLLEVITEELDEPVTLDTKIDRDFIMGVYPVIRANGAQVKAKVAAKK